MKVLAIDVGIKTLALCCAEKQVKSKHFSVVFWDIYNILEETSQNCKCVGVTKKGNVCGKKGSFISNTNHYCKLHAPKEQTQLKKVPAQKKVKEYKLQDIALAVNRTIDTVYQQCDFTGLSKIVIELQPRCNNKMKMVSHMIFGKLVDLLKDKCVSIVFVRASQKLKAYSGPSLECTLKNAYSKRKWLSVQYAKWFLEKHCINKDIWYEIFIQHGKKDDLADTLNMCMNELKIATA